jgi:hypothetical protein
MLQAEVAVVCPYCFEPITVLLDLSVDAQNYIEDCSVCCHPMTISYLTDGDSVASVDAQRLDD